ncbi:MAG: GAF domain-containing sensor histidine kinase [Chloroflexi bacterium]|nr:MAG: GAF domain-containing sensor histidine kinase [Chloroflexota bacterium]
MQRWTDTDTASRPDRKDQLLESALILASDLSLPVVLQRIIELAVKLTDARYGALGVVGSDGRLRDFITTGLTPDQRHAIGPLPVGKGILGVLIREAKPLRLQRISDDPRHVGFPANHPPMQSFLGAPVTARGRVFGNIYLTEKQSAKEFDAEDEAALLVLATQAGVAIENARLYEEARRRGQWLDSVREISSAILAGSESDTVLQTIARRARDLVSAATATIVTPSTGADHNSLTIAVADGAHADKLLGLAVPMEGSVSGDVIKSGLSTALADASRDSRAYQPMIALGSMGPMALVPLVLRGRPFGTLIVANPVGGAVFDEEAVRLVETFADQASVALEYGRAQRELNRLSVLDERERIGRELHDGVIQSLFSVGMGLQATANRSRDPEVESRVEAAVTEIDRAIRDLRNYIFGLRPGILADRQLEQALEDLAREFEEKSGVTTVTEIDGTVAAELAPRAADLVQLTREALSNVGKHAEATTCRVSLRRDGDQAILEIDDDGRGFDPGAPHSGLGLRNLMDRGLAIGGRVTVESKATEGTTVRFAVPI